MKKLMLILGFSFILFTLYGQPPLSEIRSAFFGMNTDSCSAIALFESVQSETYTSALVRAYAGAAEAAASQCVKGALNKLEFFSRGKKNLETAVEKDTDNAEIRFLRFATQVNAPRFLEYDNIREDKNLILEKLPALIRDKEEHQFWKNVAGFLLSSGKLSQNETEAVKSSLIE
jgi:shikimate 5-dehydrogenase